MFKEENYIQVPQEMKNETRWVLWKKVDRDGKATKIPLNAITGNGAKSNDSTTWATYEQACQGLKKFKVDGLGFMLGGGYFGVDIDHALDNGELIDEFVSQLRSYTEISQSGEGIHIICKGILPQGQRRKGNIEMYDNVRFLALTGNIYKGYTEIAERTEEIKILHAKYLQPQPQASKVVFKKENPNEEEELINTNVQNSDDELLQKALASKNSILFSSLWYGQWEGMYSSQSNADLALCSFLAFWTNKDPSQMDRMFRKSKLYREKWDELRGEHTYGEITISQAISTCRDTYDPNHNKNTKTVTYNPDTGEVIKVKKNYDLSDTGNARRFVDTFGDVLRYNYDNKNWVVWDSRTWTKDTTQRTKNLADRMIKEMQQEYFDTYQEGDKDKAEAMLKNIKHLSSSSGKEAMLKEAMHLEEIATTNADYDKDPFLLNCENGVVDLRTGQLLPHDKTLMLSKNTHIAVDKEGEPKEWLKALQGIFINDKDTLNFVHRAVGYTLCGSTREQCFFQCYGNGSNGKSVFLNTINGIMGDYAMNAQVESVLTRGQSSSANASPDIARMNGARFVRTNEPNEGSRFNEGLVKQLTAGNDKITARFLYGTDFEFTPVFKLWIACNYKIGVRGTDKGIWRRMRLIPFEAEFEGKNNDRTLEDKIKAELPKILWWAIKGCLEWQENGLGESEKVKIATNEYKEEMDIITSFAKECIKKRPYSKVKASEVYRAYKNWARNGNEYEMPQAKFGREMAKKFHKENVNGFIYYMGIDLKKEDEATYVYTKEKGDEY